jgi:nucleoside-diphosphate-sugar epimerase
MNPLTIAVTGSAGFIGTHAVRQLEADGHRVLGLDLRETPGPDRFVGDIRDMDALDSVITGNTDVILHLAAVAGVTPSIDSPERYVDHNVDGTLKVLQAAHANRVPRIVVASSSSVYGNCSTAARESRKLRPLSPYAASKIAAEALAETYAERRLIEVAVVRPFTVYGPGQRADMAFSKFIHAQSIGEPVAMWPFVRDFTYVDDLIVGLVGAATCDLRARYRVFNLGSGRPVSAQKLIRAFEAVTGDRLQVGWGSAKPGEPERTHADTSRARAELGFVGGTSLEAGLAAQIASSRGSQPLVRGSEIDLIRGIVRTHNGRGASLHGTRAKVPAATEVAS